MYEINKNYKEFISKNETIQTDLTPSKLILKFLWKNPDDFIINSMKKEPFFQLYFKSEIMFLLIKFQGLNWIDIPCFFKNNALFSYEGKNFPCKILLANSNTGKLFLTKECFMPDGITKAFIQGIHTQKNMDNKKLKEKINSIQSSYSASEILRLSLGKIK